MGIFPVLINETDMIRPTVENSDGQVKLIQDRINLVETHFANLCSAYGAYCRKTAHLRDKGDNISKCLREFAAAETLNRSLRNGLGRFSDCLTAIEDYRQTMIDRMEVKVISQLASYDTTCKMAKENVRTTLRARNRQLDRRRQLQKARDRAPMNRQEISMAETALTKATVDASQTLKQLEDLMDSFEQKKLQGIKKILLDYVNIELSFHVKAIEVYTKAFNDLKSVNEDDDLHEFRDCLKLSPESMDHLDLVRSIVEQSPSHRVGNASTTRGNSIQSLVGQLQALHDKQNDETTDDDDIEGSENELESISSTEQSEKPNSHRKK